MLKVDQYDYIRQAHRLYGKKVKEISRETGHSKNTVKKALRQEYIGYHTRENQPYPALGSYIKIIERLSAFILTCQSTLLNFQILAEPLIP